MMEQGNEKIPLYSKENIMDTYQLSEQSQNNMWRYEFTVIFEDRKLTLACRTVNELDNWVRIFSLLLKMKELGVGLTSVNPFVFEQ